jgi:hypothetical protein
MVVYRIALMEDGWRLLKVGVFEQIQLVGLENFKFRDYILYS